MTTTFTYDLTYDFDPYHKRSPHGVGGPLWHKDLREETRLSSWSKPGWIFAGSHVEQIRSRSAERQRRAKRIEEIYGGMQPWIMLQHPPFLVLAFGDWRWTDYTLRTSFCGGRDGLTGVAFRYQDARHHYLLAIEQDRGLQLLRRDEDELTLLASASLPSYEWYTVRVCVEGHLISASVDNGPSLQVTDDSYPYGRAALVCEGASSYGPVHVEGEQMAAPGRPLPQAPEMQLLAATGICEPMQSGRAFLVDVDSDGLPELITYNQHMGTLHCQHFKRGPMWTLGPFDYPLSQGGDIPFQAFDIDGDGKKEFVLAAGFRVFVADAITGEVLTHIPTPPANPYGENERYPYDQLLVDALCPVTTSLGEPPGFYPGFRRYHGKGMPSEEGKGPPSREVMVEQRTQRPQGGSPFR